MYMMMNLQMKCSMFGRLPALFEYIFREQVHHLIIESLSTERRTVQIDECCNNISAPAGVDVRAGNMFGTSAQKYTYVSRNE